MKEYIGLISDDATIEYNARFLLGDECAERLEENKWYKYEELLPGHFLNTCTQSKNHKHKWKRTR